ncbi:MAG: hypothetical protein DMG39_03530 [Acidobacteria bacterium]|nr:MAG: hypothetical protein DMG39_03530 [Acidobacteriota bacterium]
MPSEILGIVSRQLKVGYPATGARGPRHRGRMVARGHRARAGRFEAARRGKHAACCRRVRELHWHPNADEWQFFITGKARMTVFATVGRARTLDFDAGDVGYVQKTLPHYVENTGNTDLKFLEMFKSSYYQDLALSEWLSHTPPELVAAQLNLDKATLDARTRGKAVILPE